MTGHNFWIEWLAIKMCEFLLYFDDVRNMSESFYEDVA